MLPHQLARQSPANADVAIVVDDAAKNVPVSYTHLDVYKRQIYNCIDCNTAVFSNKWIDYLRSNIKFSGVVFTDDLSMAGAGVVGGMVERVNTAYRAGCDMLLVCNCLLYTSRCV